MKKPRAGKRQFAALVIRIGEESGPEVLLITSRGTGRWVIPKGWPMPRRTPLEAAMIGAYEEAGVVGRALAQESIGAFRYRKLMRSGLEAQLRVDVFLIQADEMLDDWPERAERTVEWFKPAGAASRVAEPALAKIIRRLPRALAELN